VYRIELQCLKNLDKIDTNVPKAYLGKQMKINSYKVHFNIGIVPI